jgi:uncharacterized DUF497 family protein
MKLKFEWDEEKNDINIMKHGISFNEAKMIFYDHMRYEIPDQIHSIKEERWKITGLVGWTVFTASCTERNGRIRIISARKADKKEEEEYFNGYCTANNKH